MSKAYRLLLGLCATAATLSSCSRSTYSFNNSAPAYLGSQPARTAPMRHATPVAAAPVVAAPAVAPVAEAPVAAPVAPATVTTLAPKESAVKPVAAAPVARPATVAPLAAASAPAEQSQPTALATTAPAKKLSLVQRLALKKLSKQLAKIDTRKQNAAHTTRIGGGLAIIIVGLALEIIAIIASSGALGVIGGIVLVVGIVVLVLSL